MPPMPAPPPPPPPPPAPPPAPVSAGQKVATIQSKAAAPKGAMDKTKGTAAFAAPTRRIQTIQGQTTGLNVPTAE